jgi:hypothetical protein
MMTDTKYLPMQHGHGVGFYGNHALNTNHVLMLKKIRPVFRPNMVVTKL